MSEQRDYGLLGAYYYYTQAQNIPTRIRLDIIKPTICMAQRWSDPSPKFDFFYFNVILGKLKIIGNNNILKYIGYSLKKLGTFQSTYIFSLLK